MKPKTKEELIDRIQRFWATVDAVQCTRYIQQLWKVIELDGDATRY